MKRDRHHLAFFPQSKTIDFCVNRVQDTFVNTYDSRGRNSPEQLFEAFERGMRLDWQRLINAVPHKMHVGMDEFNLVR